MRERLYPKIPLVGVGALVFRDASVLLIRRGKPPLEGAWSLPGGRCRENESLPEAVKREAFEECSIDIEVQDLLKLFEYIERDKNERVKYHYVVFDFKALYRSGTLQHSSDASDARWIPLDELDSYELSDAVLEVVREATRTL
jgi:8-oxo-dGTP diphosphatase